jgi:hypothetical protein
MENILVPKRLNEAQLVLLRLFDRPILNEEVIELRDFLVAYYNQKLQIELNKVISEKQLTVQDIDQLSTFENRTEKLRQIRNRL